MSSATIEPAVARITAPGDDSFRGTAFAIDDRRALTAFHCVSSNDPRDPSARLDEVELGFLAGERVRATVVEARPDEDWAVLDLAGPLSPASRPIPLRREVQAGDQCRCLGFAQVAASVGIYPALATVAGTEGRRDGARVITLYSDPLGAGMQAHGMSGGPVLTMPPIEEAVGLVRSHLGRRGDPSRPEGGTLVACPSGLFMDAPAVARPEVPADGSDEERLEAVARTGDTGAAARLGHLLHAAGQDEAAEPWLYQAARGGHAAAAYTLGRLIELDPSRADEALDWFRRSAVGGDVFGATTMGIRLRQAGRNDAALPWLEAAVERGDAMAAHTLARVYEDLGRRDEAERWERYAAERGDVRAAYDLGRMLLAEDGREEAVGWLRRASIDPDAARLLSELGEPLEAP